MRMVQAIIWYGDLAQANDLAMAVHHNCSCQSGYCGAHQAMLDQRWLNGILFARHLREQLLREEGVTCRSRQSVRTR